MPAAAYQSVGSSGCCCLQPLKADLLCLSLPPRPTDGTCHEISFFTTHVPWPENDNDDTARQWGTEMCLKRLGGDWSYVRTKRGPWNKDYEPDGADTYYKHFCRRCGLPTNAILMWRV